MNKTLMVGLLALGGGMAISYGQGFIQFDTYNADNANGILCTVGAAPLDNAWTGVLLYSLTPINEAASNWGLPGLGWTIGSTAHFGTSPIPAGYLIGPNLVIPSYTGGLVYFEIAAFNGATLYTSTLVGHTASFSMPMATGTTLPWIADGNPLYGGSGIVDGIHFIPEPGAMALMSLGTAGFLTLRRRWR